MKTLILSLFVIASLTVLSNKLLAQYPIPSFNVPVIADPTTFEEATTNNSFNRNLLHFNPFSQKPVNMGERTLCVRTNDQNVLTTAWATIEIYSLDESITYGPFTVYEGTPFQYPLSTEFEWGVRTLAASEGCEMDVWHE